VWRNNGLRADDYEQAGVFTGSLSPVGSFSVPYYVPIASSIAAPFNQAATVYTKRDGYYQRFMGFEVAATKRMSDRWMARVGFSTNSHKEYFDGPEAMTDPTHTLGNPNVDGGTVIRSSGGSGKSGIYQVLPSYQFIATGAYQARWGINLGMNLVVRQGFARPYNHTRVATGDPLGSNKTLLLVNEATDFRLPAVTSLDFRVGKEFTFGGRARVNFDVDVFNLLNRSTVLGREYDLRLSRADTVREIMNPRVLRLGLRFGF
jgi:hypothetical protein